MDLGKISRSEWIVMYDAVSLLIEAGLLPPFEYDATDNCYYMAPGAEEAQTKLFCPIALSGFIRFRAFPAGRHEEFPNGPQQDIPSSYFHRERLFYGTGQISRMPCDPSAGDWRRDKLLADAGYQEPDWLEVLIGGQGLANLIAQQGTQQSAATTVLAKRTGPDLDRVIDTLRVARVWKAERAAAGTLPTTPRARALACFEDRGSDLKHGFDALRKMFEGNYAAARRAVEEGRAVAIWDS